MEIWVYTGELRKDVFPVLWMDPFKYLNENFSGVPFNFFRLGKEYGRTGLVSVFNDESNLFILFLSKFTFVLCAQTTRAVIKLNAFHTHIQK